MPTAKDLVCPAVGDVDRVDNRLHLLGQLLRERSLIGLVLGARLARHHITLLPCIRGRPLFVSILLSSSSPRLALTKVPVSRMRTIASASSSGRLPWPSSAPAAPPLLRSDSRPSDSSLTISISLVPRMLLR